MSTREPAPSVPINSGPVMVEDYSPLTSGPSTVSEQRLTGAYDHLPPADADLSWAAYARARLTRFKYYLAHAWGELTKRKFQYCLGFFSIFIVVLVAAVCFTMVAKAPAIFLQQAEGTGGQIDLSISVGSTSGAAYLNYTTIDRLARSSSEAMYSSPRVRFPAVTIFSPACASVVRKAGITEGVDDVSQPAPWMYVGDPRLKNTKRCGPASTGCLDAVCSASAKDALSARIIAINTEEERKMGLGREWEYPPIPQGSILLAANVATYTRARVGDTVFVRIFVGDMPRGSLFLHYLTYGLRRLDKDEVDKYLPHDAVLVWEAAIKSIGSVIDIPFKVAGVVSSFKNKFSDDDTGPLAVVEMETLLPHLFSHLHPGMALNNITELASISRPIYETSDLPYKVLPWSPLSVMTDSNMAVTEFSDSVSFNIPPERVDAYLTNNYDELQRRVVRFATETVFTVGFPEVDMETPILDAVRPLRLFSLFLGLILSIILTILFVLSFMLIYSLLMISIETRTFELGVHRMTGLTRLGIVNMLLVQAASYAVPSWVLGMIVSQVLSYVVVDFLSSSVGVPLDKKLTGTAIAVATVLGLVLPFVAAILPIREALGKNLHDTLDTRHSKTLGVSFNIERSDDGKISPTALAVGVGLVVFGFLIYYLLPLSLLSMNLALFFNIFFGILVGLLFGLILLSLNFEHLVERAVVYLFFFWELRSVPQMVLKNLVAHRMRNRKTTIMYALSLGFIIFITVAYTSELESARATAFKGEGADMTVTTTRTRQFVPFTIATVIEEALGRYPNVVKDWAWISRDINYAGQFTEVATSNAGHYYEQGISLHAVSPSYVPVSFQNYYVPVMEDLSTSLSASEQLYTVRGSQSMVLSQGVASQLNLRTLGDDSTFLLNLQSTSERILTMLRLRPVATLTGAAGLQFTDRVQNDNYPGVISIPAYLAASQGAYKIVEDIMWEKLMIRLHDNPPSKEAREFRHEFSRLITSNYLSLFDSENASISDTLDSTRAMLDLIFSIATYIAMFLCLFSLIASMYSNIFESSKEIGVMRAIGLTTFQVSRIFIYEAFTLVLASSLLGVIIGFIMGWTMLLQRVLFVNLPIPFVFPWMNLVIVFAAAIICSVLASCTPIRALMRKTIAGVFRTVM